MHYDSRKGLTSHWPCRRLVVLPTTGLWEMTLMIKHLLNTLPLFNHQVCEVKVILGLTA